MCRSSVTRQRTARRLTFGLCLGLAVGGVASERPHDPPKPSSDILVVGSVQYGDSRWSKAAPRDAGPLHPVRFAVVQVKDRRQGQEALLVTTATDAKGQFAVRVPAGPSGFRDIYLNIVAETPRAVVYRPENGRSTPYSLRTVATRDIASGETLEYGVVCNNISDNNSAFGVLDAAHYSSEYASSLSGSHQKLGIAFPTDRETSMYSDQQLHILRADRFDWDVIMHEFGHRVADVHGIDVSNGGAHSFTENLSEAPGRTKRQGLTLAWSEGWASFFAVSAQQVLNLGILQMPNVGDASYTDTDDADFTLDLEIEDRTTSGGEDNELSIMRVLYDLYDSQDKSHFVNDLDEVTLGDKALWTLLTNDRCTTLASAFNTVSNGQSFDHQAYVGAVFSRHHIAPLPVEPVSGSSVETDVPRFRWLRKGGGPSYRSDRFFVEIYDASGNRLFTSLPINVSGSAAAENFSPTPEEWSRVQALGNPIRWRVVAWNSASPETGPYTSEVFLLKP